MSLDVTAIKRVTDWIKRLCIVQQVLYLTFSNNKPVDLTITFTHDKLVNYGIGRTIKLKTMFNVPCNLCEYLYDRDSYYRRS